MACHKAGHWVIDDDAVEIAAKMHDADVIAFATPVYYYSVDISVSSQPSPVISEPLK